jgi:hypothetical protein
VEERSGTAVELALLELDRGDALAMHRAAENGDADALAFFEHLWDSYRDTGTGLACFLCDAEAAFPPHTEIVERAGRRQQLSLRHCARIAATCQR